MRSDPRPTEPDLNERIEREAYRFDFFQLVYLIERWLDRCAVGGNGPMDAEALRLRPDSRLTFSPADVRWVEELPEEEGGDGVIRRLTVNFMGLYGVSAPGPVYFSELINAIDVETEDLSDFLDFFNHRLLSLYYRAWQKYRYPYRYESGARDGFSSYVLSFIGLREEEVRPLTALPIPRLLKYVGLLAPRTRPLVNLRLMIADYFRLPEVRIRPWILRWVPVPPEEQNRIGERNCELGRNFSIGERTPDRAGKFRVRIGPVSYETYRTFLPDTENFRQLCALIRLWVVHRFDYDVEIVIRRQEVPEGRLEGPRGVQLGWTGWVTSGPGLDRDPSIVFPKAA